MNSPALVRKWKGCLFLWIPVLLWLTFILFPYGWMLITSLKPPHELYTSPIKYLPSVYTFEGYRLLLETTDFPRFFANSLVVVAGTLLITGVFATSAAYCFSRINFRGKGKFFGLFLATQMFPAVLLVFSLFFIMRKLGILNTRLALIIAHSTFSLPFTTWLLTGFFNAIPRELDEAAIIDGASRWQTFWHVLAPLAAPGLIAGLTYVFIYSWNEFVYALTFTADISARTLPVGLHTFMGEYIIRWDLLTAGGVLTGLPIVVFFMLVQRYLVQGLTAGAVKG